MPDKPLADIAGLPMVVRVAQRAALSGASRVVVAADDPRIVAACERHGVEALLTRGDHLSGSDRLAEACALLCIGGDSVVVNVQGDEPLIDPALVAACATLLGQCDDCVMSTAAHPIDSAADFANPNIVKVVLDARGRALYFSRAPIPHPRGAADSPAMALRHVGLYAYRAAFLRLFPTLSAAPSEQVEALEQLRVLWHGHRIAVHVGADSGGIGVDTPADLQRVRALFGAASASGR